MAYTRKYLLQRVKNVIDDYEEYAKKGWYSNEWIYKNVIRDKYYISRSTFYLYLNIDVEAELEDISLKEQQQMSLF